MKKIGYCILLSLAFSTITCIQEIPFTPGDGSRLLVINGGISNLDEDHILYLSRTVSYGVPPDPVENAIVTLHEVNKSSWDFTETIEGKYVLPHTTFRAQTGSTYFLSIHLPNGDEYQSEPEQILPSITPDSLSWNINKEPIKSKDGYVFYIDALQVFIHTPLIENEKNVFLKWTTQSAFQFTTMPECSPFRTTYTCYKGYPINPGNIFIYSNREIGSDYLAKYKVGFESMAPNYRFMEVRYYSVYQHRLSEKAFEYFRKLDIVANQNGSIFDAIPASVQGNVYNVKDKTERVLGFFQMASAQVVRLRMVNGDFKGKYALLSKELNLCGWLRGGGGLDSPYFAACCNCGELTEPDITKPSWW